MANVKMVTIKFKNVYSDTKKRCYTVERKRLRFNKGTVNRSTEAKLSNECIQKSKGFRQK